MSDNKKVIHVKDLVIKADNVQVETQQRRHPRYDPFLGRPIPERGENEEPANEERESEQNDEGEEKAEDENDERENRGPFSWI